MSADPETSARPTGRGHVGGARQGDQRDRRAEQHCMEEATLSAMSPARRHPTAGAPKRRAARSRRRTTRTRGGLLGPHTPQRGARYGHQEGTTGAAAEVVDAEHRNHENARSNEARQRPRRRPLPRRSPNPGSGRWRARPAPTRLGIGGGFSQDGEATSTARRPRQPCPRLVDTVMTKKADATMATRTGRRGRHLRRLGSGGARHRPRDAAVTAAIPALSRWCAASS